MNDPQVTITFTRYNEPDWLVDECLDALARQEGVAGEVLFLDQAWRADYAAAVEARSKPNPNLIFRCLPCEAKRVTAARNQGLTLARHPHVLIIDPDVVADPDWAAEIVRALHEEGVTIAGSRILPRWRGAMPLLARARVVLDQYSMLDWGEETLPAPRIVSAGMGINRERPGGDLLFNEDMGRQAGRLFSGAESELCARVRAAGGRVVYAGRSVVHHQVLEERLTWRWPLKRLYYAGYSRAAVGGAPKPSRAPGFWDWALLPIILPPYAAGWLASRFARRSVRQGAGA